MAASGPRVLVVGSGGIGGVVVSSIYDHIRGLGGEVVALTTNRDIAAAVGAHGFRLTGVDGARTVKAPIVTALDEAVAPFDHILLATQPPQVEEAARNALP